MSSEAVKTKTGATHRPYDEAFKRAAVAQTGRPNICFDLLLVQAMLLDEIENQFLLLVRTRPSIGNRVDRVAVVMTVAIGRWRSLSMVSIGSVHAVSGAVRQEADFLDLTVHALLKQSIEAGTFRLDLGEVGEFGADADNVRMTAVVGQAELFGIRGLQNDCHNGWSPFGGG